MLIHTISPVFDSNSKILILGSFPSVKSRESNFFYAHQQNRFWRILGAVFEAETPKTIDEKKEFLLKYRIALWDVIKSCEITGSSDSSIKNVCANDLTDILETANIKRIFVNGRQAQKLYNEYLLKQTKIECEFLPSTSPANAAWNFEKLLNEWKKIKEAL